MSFKIYIYLVFCFYFKSGILQSLNTLTCDCHVLKFGCCGDDLTAASGPDRAGCDCAASQYGCCPDGLTDAPGDNYVGCNELPVDKKALCFLPHERGPCLYPTNPWFFSVRTGTCYSFMYGGCNLNDNRFATKKECLAVCVQNTQPIGTDQCRLWTDRGFCAGNFSRWGFDAGTRRCVEFNWGGCGGNRNRFGSRAACELRCQPTAEQERLTSQLSPRMFSTLQMLGTDALVRECWANYVTINPPNASRNRTRRVNR